MDRRLTPLLCHSVTIASSTKLENEQSRPAIIMQTIHALLEEQFKRAFFKAFSRDDIAPEITQSTQPQFGHYQCNNALKLGKEWKTNPREVAQQIIDVLEHHLEDGQLMIAHLEIAGPGFVNITLAPS